MTLEYRFRRYESGDSGEIWLIEAIDASGAVQLIGHHGIMPIRFTRGDEDLLFDKTANTMSLPEYRDMTLYPRFEKRFAEHCEGRFDALFSTDGHPAAIRQRLFRRQGALTRRLDRSRPPAERLMPRTATAVATGKGIGVRGWRVTPLVSEVR